MPKININGITREMTAEEVAEMERWATEHPAPEKSAEEKLADLTAEYQAYKEETDAALLELASLADSLATRADEHEGALVELAGLTEE